jgi:DDE superfamily endonuclease
MEHILELYHKPYDPKRPMVCLDEKSTQLLANLRVPLALQPGQVVRQDYEYKRNGTRNLFVLVEPKAGFRHVLVTHRRTKLDFAWVMRYLVDVVYPDPKCIIDVVMDNLNTHHYHSLVEIFGKPEADRIMKRLEFHYTPAHASWLNMAEIELSILSKQCLSRRVPDEWTLTTEIIAWENARNAKKANIRWNFTVHDARIVFKEHYPTSLTG